MGLYGHIWRNRFRSIALLAAFLALFELLALCLFAPWVGVAGTLEVWDAPLRAAVIWFALAYVFHVRLARGRIPFAALPRADNPAFYDLVETTAIAAGLTTPRIAVIETPALNAFSCGVVGRRSWLVVTRGLLQSLPRDELEAVVAHELMHVRHGDVALLATAMVFSGIVLKVAQAITWRHFRPSLGMVATIALAPFFLWETLILVGWAVVAGAVGALVTRFAISRAREFAADAEAVRLTKNPAALIQALRRIDGASAADSLHPGLRAMMICGESRGWLATHPSLAARITAIQRVTGVTRPDQAQDRRAPRPFGARIVDAADNGRRIFTAAAAPPVSRRADIAVLALAALLNHASFQVEQAFVSEPWPTDTAGACFGLQGHFPYRPGRKPLAKVDLAGPDEALSAFIGKEDSIEHWAYLQRTHRRRAKQAIDACAASCDERARNHLAFWLAANASTRADFARHMDRAHGEEGLAFVASLYRTQDDEAIRARIRQGFGEGLFSGQSDNARTRLRLFSTGSGETFRPCRVTR